MKSLLTELHVEPEDVATLSSKTRNQVLRFLRHWEAYGELLRCVEAIDRPDLVTMLDIEADALEGLGRLDEALALRRRRLEERESQSAQVALGRCYLRRGDLERALTLARTLATEESIMGAWQLLGDVYLERDNLDEAEAAYLHYQQHVPSSRRPALGLMEVYQRRGDPVTSAAYAVQAYAVDEGERPVPAAMLRHLRDFFAGSGDQNRLLEADTELQNHFQSELQAIRTQIQEEIDPTRFTETRSMPTTRERDGKVELRSLVTDLATVPTSAAERAELAAAAQRFFGFERLLPAQAEIMAAARRGENVLAVLPTGGGKSLCYQLPALLDEGLTLVISPLIALMKDQVDGLPPAARHHALAINSSLDGSALRQAIADASRGRYRLLYAAPERLRQPPFLHAVQQAGVARLVIDEAHCVSAWGHDFRPDYLKIAEVHRALGRPPLLAVTATAPPRVRQDIERRLFGEGERLRVIATDTYRQNLTLSVIHTKNKDEKLRRLLNLCQQLEGSGIVYAGTRRRCEEIATLLRGQGVDATHYHAGIPNRALVQDRFMRGETRIIVATVAFGMGVDKPDIRFIIHYGPPDSVETYYQEAGRAGRDGEPAHCILLYSHSDKAVLTRHANMDAIPVEFLRQVYGSVRSRLNGRRTAPVAMDDLERILRSDDTAIRVALSTLEQAGLLQRHQDVPRTVTLTWLGQADDPRLAAFVEAAHLRPGQMVTRNFLDLVAQNGIPAPELEPQLLTWQTAGKLRYDANGRDALITLLPPPADASTRIDSLISQYEAIQQQRVREIVAYARNRRCRHGYLGNYLGGAPRSQCASCDNCLDDPLLPESNERIMPEAEQYHLILATLSEQSWGHATLARILRGDPTLRERATGVKTFGCLSFRGKANLQRMFRHLLTHDLIREVTLPHGGVMLEITNAGHAALEDKTVLAGLVATKSAPKEGRQRPAGDAPGEALDTDAAALYEALTAWRLQQARENGVPAYVVAHNRVLRAVAQAKPATEAELLEISGVGPATVGKYGAALLAIVRGESLPAEEPMTTGEHGQSPHSTP